MTVQLESVTFTSGDGETSIPSYLATPDGAGPHPSVLILRGVAGPDDGYTEIARRLAEWGYVALLHGWKVRGANPPDAPVYADLKGALTFLRSVSLADQRRLAVFGFCRGGVHALMAARAHEEIRVIVVFHGFAFRSAHSQPGAQPYDLAEGVNVPMLVRSRICIGWRPGCGSSAKSVSSGSTTAPATASPCAPIPATTSILRSKASTRRSGFWKRTSGGSTDDAPRRPGSNR